MPSVLNDVHSQLNPTEVAEIVRPRSLGELVAAVKRARRDGAGISVAGGRHAMGGQQFARGAIHLDLTAMNAVLGSDAERGLLRIEAGACWPQIIAAARALDSAGGVRWGIRQKQTGVDDVTLGGSISANAHGRGLAMQPLGGDIEDLTLVDAEGRVIRCSRDENAELFSRVIGGYGLFGVIHAATLRLAPRQWLAREVSLIDLDDAEDEVRRRIEEGCLFGDFQFAIDAADAGFLRQGVLCCYRPVTGPPARDRQIELGPEAWLDLIRLAHVDKRAAFRRYATHYLATHGQCYESDTLQLATYIPGYAEFLEKSLAEGTPRTRETLVIGEHYVPPGRLVAFMAAAREILRRHGTEVIYGTIRLIRRDDVSFLPWAREDFACVIFNLRTPHTPAGQARTAETFRALIDAANALGGSFFLTYHRHATVAQVERAHPRFREWLRLKSHHDPDGRFTSDWFRHYHHAFENA